MILFKIGALNIINRLPGSNTARREEHINSLGLIIRTFFKHEEAKSTYYNKMTCQTYSTFIEFLERSGFNISQISTSYYWFILDSL